MVVSGELPGVAAEGEVMAAPFVEKGGIALEGEAERFVR